MTKQEHPGVILQYLPYAPKPVIYNLDGPPSLERLQDLVGGNIERVPLWDEIEWDGAVCQCVAYLRCDDEERDLKKNMLNGAATELWHDHFIDPIDDVLIGHVIVLIGDAVFRGEEKKNERYPNS